LPFFRQQAGRLASALTGRSGAISVQLNNIISEIAMARRMAKQQYSLRSFRFMADHGLGEML
jgi:hypothetical protein